MSRRSPFLTMKCPITLQLNTMDTYWFRSDSEKDLSYQDIQFKENKIDALALYGNPNGFSLKCSVTPE